MQSEHFHNPRDPLTASDIEANPCEHTLECTDGRRAWLASLMLSRPDRFLSRLALGISRLRALPRVWRRQLRRRAAATAAGAALILAMAGSALIAPPPVHAANITVNTSAGVVADDGECSLIEAILNANGDNRVFDEVGECAMGAGADTINLTTDVTLTYGYSEGPYSNEYNGLPLVTSKITIEGNGHTIETEFDDEEERFRVLAVVDDGDLVLNDVIISGGREELGGAIFNASMLTLRQSTVTNGSAYIGGAIANTGEVLNIEDSIITENYAYGYGGGIATNGLISGDSVINITYGSLITYNHANFEGGGIHNICSEVTLKDSNISENNASYDLYLPPPGPDGMTISGAFRTAADSERVARWMEGAESSNGRSFADWVSRSFNTMDMNPQEILTGAGGGVFNTCYGTFRAIDSVISGNTAGFSGGGIYNYFESKVYIDNSVIDENDGGGYGGGILNLGLLEVTDSTIDDNDAKNGGGQVQIYGHTTIENSTISNNEATYGNGGGLLQYCGVLAVNNSTISGNSAKGFGGGLYLHYASEYIYCIPGSVTLSFSTIVNNSVEASGGGIGRGSYADENAATLELFGNIISGNTATHVLGIPNLFTGNDVNLLTGFNILGEDNDSGAVDFTPDATDIIPAAGVNLDDIIDTSLTFNGGPTETHLLKSNSPALDVVPNDDCDSSLGGNSRDQRGAPRNQNGVGGPSDNECDAGAVEGTEFFEGIDLAIYMSAKAAGTTADGLPFGSEDILMWDGVEWSTFFDGSAALLMPKKAKHNVNAFWVGDGEDDIVMSFAQNRRFVPGIDHPVDGLDLVRWNGSTFEFFFDGSDVDLTKKTPEKIDALHVLPGAAAPQEFGGVCQSYLLISTQGPGKVQKFGGGALKFGGEDVLGFCALSLGEDTSGHWHMVLDASTEGMPKNATASISLSADSETMYLTTKKPIKINSDGVIGGHSVVFAFDFNTSQFSGPHFSAPANGLNRQVDGLEVVGGLE